MNALLDVAGEAVPWLAIAVAAGWWISRKTRRDNLAGTMVTVDRDVYDRALHAYDRAIEQMDLLLWEIDALADDMRGDR